ncbi:MAG TPA: hypothetical protein VF708_06400 [Pyrinomonadaceae bacterium]|jgi:hypothetical protein
MSEANWEKERKELLEHLQKANQVALESQAEAAMYREMLEDWYEVAQKASASKDFSLLQKINKRLVPFHLPSKEQGKEWGKLFLQAYMRDARWLGHAKKSLEKIKADAEKLTVEDNDSNAKLKRSIISAAEEGLIVHI